MCCLLLVAGLIGPRVAFVLTWIFSDRTSIAFHNSFLWPLFGVILLPWTALAYVFAYTPIFGVSTLGWVIVALGFFLDLATYAGNNNRSGSRASA